jgi:hypothetical protein
MKLKSLWTVTLAMGVAALPVRAAETPKDMAATYETLADAILAVRKTEENFVRALLDGHRHAAEAMLKRGDIEACAAEMSLWASEGDNAVGGVRKKLLEGGHHHNAAGEAQGIYEPGFVVVTREAKKAALDAAAAVQKATSDEEKTKAWDAFAKAVDSVKK